MASDSLVFCFISIFFYNNDFVFRSFPVVSGIGRGEENDTATTRDRSVTLNVYRCYYEGCTPPPDPETLPLSPAH